MANEYAFLMDSSSAVNPTAAPSSGLDGAASGIQWDSVLTKALDTYLATEKIDAQTKLAMQPGSYYRAPGTSQVLPSGQTAVSPTMKMGLAAVTIIVVGAVLFRVLK